MINKVKIAPHIPPSQAHCSCQPRSSCFRTLRSMAVYLRPAELHALGDGALETCFDPVADHRPLKLWSCRWPAGPGISPRRRLRAYWLCDHRAGRRGSPRKTLKRAQECRQFEDKLIGDQPLTLSEVERSPRPWRESDVLPGSRPLMPAFLRAFALKAHFASAPQDQHNLTSRRLDTRSERQMPVPCHGACSPEETKCWK